MDTKVYNLPLSEDDVALVATALANYSKARPDLKEWIASVDTRLNEVIKK